MPSLLRRVVTCWSTILPTLLLATAAVTPLPSQAQAVTTVPAVDLQRYAGKWYEIARLPNSFQKKCLAEVSAEYKPRSDGDIDVVNRCQVEGGKIDEAVGLARVVPGTNNAKLQVRFAPGWLSVGTPSRDYLWILSRTPTISAAQYEAAVNNATRQGFDTARLEKTVQ